MNITDQLEHVRLPVAQDGLVTPLKEVPDFVVLAVEVARVPLLEPPA